MFKPKKCKYFFSGNCPYVQPEGFTCNHEDEAWHYCGTYKMMERGILPVLKP